MLIRITAPHFVAGLVVEDHRIVAAAPILRWAKKYLWAEAAPLLRHQGYTIERLEEMEDKMKCPTCSEDQLRAHVTLSYDVPLAAREGAIRVGNMKISKLDLREAWQALTKRPIWCLNCHATFVWNTETQQLEEDDW